MTKILLVAVNASYSHTSLSVRELCEYVKAQYIPDLEIDFRELTINQPFGDILREIAVYEPNVVLFSTYIWNGEIICKIITDLKKILPDVIIGCGGPEFGFSAEKSLKSLKSLDFIMKGEGEKILAEISELAISEFDFMYGVKYIKGIFFRGSGEEIIYTGDMELISNLSRLPFPYPFLKNKETITEEEKNHKIYYYESSRGCPFSCSYCMSSVERSVRFMPLERVFRDLQIFLDSGVSLVKFVDRTYNINPDRYIAIWDYIVKHHNGKTMFHFEIEGEFLSDEALDFLQTVPEGVMQFEIGVQSSNKKTLRAVSRSDNTEKLAANILRIPPSIHKHLDLIAGLPYEDMESFGMSFDYVMSLKPDALQLGFLKVLSGTAMEKYALAEGWKWMENPVYETFSTPYMSYKDMLFLKDVEVAVDAYWNSGVFGSIMGYIGRKVSLWQFFKTFTSLSESKGVFSDARRETFWFGLFAQWINELGDFENILDKDVLYDLLRYDFIIRGKQGNFPQWYSHVYNKERHRAMLEADGGITNARLDFGHSEYEVFDYNVDAPEPENCKGQYEKLIRYKANNSFLHNK